MKFRALFVCSAFAFALAIPGWAGDEHPTKQAQAQEHPAKKSQEHPSKKADEHPAKASMDAQQQAMMEAWMKIATPGVNHKYLEPMIGTFDAKMTMWEPGQPPTESTGTAENTWILGGRFVMQTVKSTFMGMPFEGVGYTGYDNLKKKYVGVWMDSMGTMMMTSWGSCDATGKEFSFSSEMDDPMTGKPCKIREVARVLDNNKHTFEMYGTKEGEPEAKMMEIVYTRKK